MLLKISPLLLEEKLDQDATDGITVTGTTSLDVTSGTDSDVSLLGANNDFGGAVTVLATDTDSDVTIVDKNDILIGSFNVGKDVTLTSTAGSINDASDDAAVDFTAGGLITLTAQDEIGVDATGFTEKYLEVADGSKLDLTSTTSGGIGVTSKGSVELVDVDTKDGSIVVGAEGLITATDVLSEGSTADAISLSTTKDGVLATKVISADSVTITATTGGVTATSVTAGNDVTITASSDIIGTSITASDEVSITTSLGDVTVGTISATGGVLGITATTGSINDASDDNLVDLTAGGLITLTAEDEIGEHATFTDKELELAAGSSIDASSTTVGAIRLDGLGDLTLTDVDTGNGIITVTAVGLLSAIDVASLKDDDSNDITLTGLGIAATSINAGSIGDVTLDAGTGAISQDGVDDKDDIIAHILKANATTGIDLDTTVEKSEYLTVTGVGNIVIDESNSIVLTDVDTNNELFL